MKTIETGRAAVKIGRILGVSLLLAGIVCFPSEAGTWQSLPQGGYRYLGDEGAPVTGWFEDDEKWYYGGVDGIILTNTMTPDGYYVDRNGGWYRRSTEILGTDFQAPERFLTRSGEAAEWPGEESLNELASSVRTAFGGERFLKIQENGLEYKTSEGDLLIGIYPDSVYGGWRLDLAVDLDPAADDLTYASAYNYQIFLAFLYQVTSAPEEGAAGIWDGWNGDNSWGLSRTMWTTVGDMRIRYGASHGMGHFWLISGFNNSVSGG